MDFKQFKNIEDFYIKMKMDRISSFDFLLTEFKKLEEIKMKGSENNDVERNTKTK